MSCFRKMTQGEKDTEETNDQDEQEHISPRVFDD